MSVFPYTSKVNQATTTTAFSTNEFDYWELIPSQILTDSDSVSDHQDVRYIIIFDELSSLQIFLMYLVQTACQILQCRRLEQRTSLYFFYFLFFLYLLFNPLSFFGSTIGVTHSTWSTIAKSILGKKMLMMFSLF